MAKRKTPRPQQNGGQQQPMRQPQGNKAPVIVRRPPRHQGR